MLEEKPYWKKLRNAGLIIISIGLLFGIVFGPVFASSFNSWNIAQGFTSFLFLILGGVLILIGIIIIISFEIEKKKIEKKREQKNNR